MPAPPRPRVDVPRALIALLLAVLLWAAVTVRLAREGAGGPNGVSGNGVSGNGVSGNGVSGNGVSGNGVSGGPTRGTP